MKKLNNTSAKFKTFQILILLLLISTILPYSCLAQNKIKIALANPGQGDLRSIIYFLENKIIDIPDAEILCVYYEKARNSYDASKRYVENNNYTFVELRKVDGDLNTDNLFGENDCSDEFYKIFNETDGIIFFGGADIPPVIFGQKTGLLTNISTPFRHYFELSFLFHLLGGSQDKDFKPFLEENPDYLVWGFCLGMQTINVAAGGTLHQDIPTDVYDIDYVEDILKKGKQYQHRNYWRSLYRDRDLMGVNFHRIKFKKDSYLIKELASYGNENPSILSSHHQAVKNVGMGFEIAATSMDGKVIEATTHKKYKNVLGYQFHLESMSLYLEDSTRKYKFSPEDKEAFTYYEILQTENSYKFHRNIWNYFSRCLREAK